MNASSAVSWTIQSGKTPAALWGMAGVRHFRELVCWQLACELKVALYRFVERPQVRRDFRFYSQVRDAAASAPRNIAEGFGRRTHADFAHFLDVARASLGEYQNHLQDAVDRGYLSADDFKTTNALAERACSAVAGLQRSLRRPCGPFRVGSLSNEVPVRKVEGPREPVHLAFTAGHTGKRQIKLVSMSNASGDKRVSKRVSSFRRPPAHFTKSPFLFLGTH